MGDFAQICPKFESFLEFRYRGIRDIRPTREER